MNLYVNDAIKIDLNSYEKVNNRKLEFDTNKEP